MRRLCRVCGREIVAEMVKLEGGDDVANLGGVDPVDADQATIQYDESGINDVRPEAVLRPTICLSCGCDHIHIETVATVSPRQVPDVWAPAPEDP